MIFQIAREIITKKQLIGISLNLTSKCDIMSASKQNEEINRKIKIRKVVVDSVEYFEELDSILMTFESIPGNAHSGCPLSLICKNLGIQELDFWRMKNENDIDFEKRFNIIRHGIDLRKFNVWRKETYKKRRD